MEYITNPNQILNTPDPDFQFTEYGLIIKGKPSFEQWQNTFNWLSHIDKASPWIAGDMLAYGEANYSEFSQTLDDDNDEPEDGHYSYGSLRIYKHVSMRWPLLNRLTNVPYSWHQITASLPMAKRLELIQEVLDGPKEGRRKSLEIKVRSVNNGNHKNPVTYPSDNTHAAEVENYQKQQKLNDIELENEQLKQQVKALQQSVIMPESQGPLTYGGTLPDGSSLSELEQGWIAGLGDACVDNGWEAITVYRDGRFLVTPRKDSER